MKFIKPPFIFLLIILILIHLESLTIAQPDFLYSFCNYNHTVTYTNGSTFQTNLDTIPSYLLTNDRHYYSFSISSNLNEVNVIALCRADVAANQCRTCLTNSITKLRKLCTNETQAIGWYDECMLRYSDLPIANKMEIRPAFYMWNLVNTSSDPGKFSESVRMLLNIVREEAAGGGSDRKFATGNMSVQGNLIIYDHLTGTETQPSDLRIYGLAECTPDLSRKDCDDCLNRTIGMYPEDLATRIGGRALGPRCNFRYEIRRFYGDAPPLPQDFVAHNCNYDNTVSYANRSAIQTYLDAIPSRFTAGDLHFYSFSLGSNLSRVNVIALCRADVAADRCRTCFNNSITNLRKLCTNETQAIGWYDECMLRYDDRPIDNKLEIMPNASAYNTSPTSDPTTLGESVRTLLNRLRREAAGGGSVQKFATGDLSGPGNLIINDTLASDLRIYGLAECTPDLSEEECSDCLNGAIEEIPVCCDGRIGARVLRPSCNLRYEIGRFYAPPPPPGGNNRKKIVVVTSTTLAAAAAVVILVLGVYRWHRIKREQKEERILLHRSEAPTSIEGSSRFQSDEDESGEMHFFNLKTIQEATNNFSIEYKLGEGGFGPVYKGKLNDGRVVAVKRLSKNSGQGLQEFKTEVRLIVKLQHKNLVRLLGCCTQKGEKLLIYEFMPNNSLDTFLFDQEKCRELDWPMRANIVGGIAKGLRYLHEDSRLRIIHRDMKASNVLLDDSMNAKISDFGTARIFGGNQIEANTNRIVGTYGYMAPEYAMEGVFSTKSDIYSFGVLLLEIISGKRNSGFYHPEHLQNLLSYAWRMWKEGMAEQLIDENIMESCLVSEALRWTNIALLCVQEDPNDRPTMSSVVFMLEGQWTSLPQPSEPPFSAIRFIMSDQSSSTGAAAGFFAYTQSSTSASNTS